MWCLVYDENSSENSSENIILKIEKCYFTKVQGIFEKGWTSKNCSVRNYICLYKQQQIQKCLALLKVIHFLL